MVAQDTVFYEKVEQIFNHNSPPLIMGILNVTPDSFFDGGKFTSEIQWLEHTQQMIDEGADIIDIGAYSTRPGATNVSEKEEMERLVNVIKSVRKQFPELLISADTFRASIAIKAIESGANIINDISGGTMDDMMFSTIAKLKVPYILMHIQGTPKTMQQNPHYENVTEDVFAFFTSKLKELKELGVSKVILDPGFGFGKTLKHNYQLLENLEKFNSIGSPVLVGFSRKSMVCKLLNINPEDALNGTSVLNTIALEKGAKILRVHDVKEAKEAVMIVEYFKKNKNPDKKIQ
ncbi:MAG: dihydropteroate synthase [Bacteroidota bacterium]|nr:dihydropteroate synthase [Bacteroidota bacterium]